VQRGLSAETIATGGWRWAVGGLARQAYRPASQLRDSAGLLPVHGQGTGLRPGLPPHEKPWPIRIWRPGLWYTI